MYLLYLNNKKMGLTFNRVWRHNGGAPLFCCSLVVQSLFSV